MKSIIFSLLMLATLAGSAQSDKYTAAMKKPRSLRFRQVDCRFSNTGQ
jgi:hypothetical protein